MHDREACHPPAGYLNGNSHLVFARRIQHNCGVVNHIREHFSSLSSCRLRVDQKLILTAYQS